jgi:hypothetical protein
MLFTMHCSVGMVSFSCSNIIISTLCQTSTDVLLHAGIEHPSWRQWLQATRGMSHLMNDETHYTSQSPALTDYHPPEAHWTVLCNGKPAWFLGRLPCFGNLSVTAEVSRKLALICVYLFLPFF